MLFSKKFVSATIEKSDINCSIPAPYMRRDLILDVLPDFAEITVCGLGFYRIFVNGKEITKGHISPYVVNSDQVLPYDNYDLTDVLTLGSNTVGFMLGNGMQNSFDGYIWDFQLAEFNSSPKLAFAIEMSFDGRKRIIEADGAVLCCNSPIYFDGYRMGEKYDARLEIPNWNTSSCNLSDWTPAIVVDTDRGEPMLTCNRPITVAEEIKPLAITEEDDGYLYDFGRNYVGLTRLSIKGYAGQKVRIDHGELLVNGKFSQSNLIFDQPKQKGMPEYTQRTEYTCKGEGLETHVPSFTYYGFRYAKVTGISSAQATPDLLTCMVMNTDLGDRGGFVCSDETLNSLQEMTRRSTLGNFQHFPNDCPHREKNGWTADAALSAEHTIMNFEPEDNYLMWERCICRAMDERGALPGIVPTGGWGFHWGNGPAWDSVLIWLPYFTAVLRDDLRLATEAAPYMIKYFEYLETRRDERGLISIGLGDWCPAYPDMKTPLVFTDSTVSYDLGIKASYLYDRLGMADNAEYCRAFAESMRKSIRTYLLEDNDIMRFSDGGQTAQAMAIFYGLCDNEEEKQRALGLLIDRIAERDGHMGVGVLGGRVLFRVLCDYGYEDLAVSMITRPDEPSYGCMVADGLTTLAEKVKRPYGSLNHHFWGDISALMLEYFAGIRINPDKKGADTLCVSPVFPSQITFAKGYHNSIKGRIDTYWRRISEDEILLELSLPREMSGDVVAPKGYRVESSIRVTAATGKYIFKKIGYA